MRRWKGLALAGALVLIFIAVVVWMAAPKPVRFVSGKGQVTTLKEYHFTTNTVEYSVPGRSVLEKLLPKALRKRFSRAPQRIYSRPNFPAEPMLSCGVTVQVRDPAGGRDGWIGRVVVGDELGNEFDPVVQSAANMGEEYSVLEASAFPRRGRVLKLKLKANDATVAEFVIPNPARGEYPQWQATDLPVRAKAGDLEVRLVDFASERPSEYSGDNYPNTLCVFELVQNGVVTTNWVPIGVEIRDATGNRWQPGWHRQKAQYEEGKLKVPLMGALWAGEAAWKVQVDFRRVAGFAAEELIRWEGLEVPLAAEVVRPSLAHEEADGQVELLGLFGPNADREPAQKIFLNINPRFGSVTIALKLALVEFDRAFSLVGIYDENGRGMEVVEVDHGPLTAEDERYVPLLIHFKPRVEVKKVNMVFALPKSRRVEFLAKPVQKR